MTVEEMKKVKEIRGYSYQMIAELSGVPLGTVIKIFTGETKAPRYRTLAALSAALNTSQDADRIYVSHGEPYTVMPAPRQEKDALHKDKAEYNAGPLSCGVLRDGSASVRYTSDPYPGSISKANHPHESEDTSESASRISTAGASSSSVRAFPASRVLPENVKKTCARFGADADFVFHKRHQGEFTIEDFDSIWEDHWVELIDGIIYDMSAPGIAHQLVVSQLIFFFQSFIQQNGGPCMVLPGPSDVWLDQDDRTKVEPDLSVLCRPDSQDGRQIIGGPDLVVEVISPSSRRRDMILKLHKYLRAGVREYWIIDLKNCKVIVYDNTNPSDVDAAIYGFTSIIPVAIYHGEMKIDFNLIYQKIKGMAGVGMSSGS